MHQYRLICSFSGSLYKIESDDVDTQFFHNFDIEPLCFANLSFCFFIPGPLISALHISQRRGLPDLGGYGVSKAVAHTATSCSPKTNLIFLTMSLVNPFLDRCSINGRTSSSTRSKPKLNEFSLRGSLPLFSAIIVDALTQHVSIR